MAENPRWLDLDGFIHVVGDCPSCQPDQRMRCPKCGGRRHWQALHGGYADPCEKCDEGWEASPVPPHDEIGMRDPH